MKTDDICVVILTKNESSNIRRTLSRLRWAPEVVIVDSFSDDDTLDIAREFDNVRVVQRPFDQHARQWNYGIHETGITRPWILALDADYLVPDTFVKEIEGLEPRDATTGLRANFVYCVDGKALRGSLYPSNIVLFKKSAGEFFQDGHTQRLKVKGDVQMLQSRLLHDDRKSLSHWLAAQDRYMTLEVDVIRNSSFADLAWADRIRKIPGLSPFVVLLYVLFVKGAILDGRAGLTYAVSRVVAESILTIKLLQPASEPVSPTRQ